MKRKILLASYYAPPLINAESILVWKTVKELARTFDVHMITATLARNARIDASMSLPPGVHIEQRSSYMPNSPSTRRVFEKAIGLISEEQSLWASLHVNHHYECDVIYSRSHPGASHVLAYHLQKALRKPWIAQFSDPWTQNPYHTGKTIFRKAVDRYWERRVVEHADKLIFPTEEIADMYEQAYEAPKIRQKTVILPHHYMPDLYPRTTHERDKSKVTFAYFGDFYGVRSPAPFLDALQHISCTSPEMMAQLEITFFGNIERKFLQQVEQSPIPIQNRRVSYFESLQFMGSTDILLLIDAPSPSGTNPFLASKLIDYLGAGKRILGITDLKGTSADILRQFGHYVVSPHDREGIVQALLQCVKTVHLPVERPVTFTTEHIIRQLANVIQDIADETHSDGR